MFMCYCTEFDPGRFCLSPHWKMYLAICPKMKYQPISPQISWLNNGRLDLVNKHAVFNKKIKQLH